jgi:hypothetical protein
VLVFDVTSYVAPSWARNENVMAITWRLLIVVFVPAVEVSFPKASRPIPSNRLARKPSNRPKKARLAPTRGKMTTRIAAGPKVVRRMPSTRATFGSLGRYSTLTR